MTKRLLALLSLGLLAATAHAQTVFFSENFNGATTLPAGWTNNSRDGGNNLSATSFAFGGGVLSFVEAASGGGLTTRTIDLSSAILGSGVTLSFDFEASSATYDALGIGFTTNVTHTGPDTWALGWNDPSALASQNALAGDRGPRTVTYNISPLLAGYDSNSLSTLRVFFIPRLPNGALGGNAFTDFGTITIDNIAITGVSAVPEPSTYAALLGAVALGLAAWRRRASRHAAS